MKKTVRLIGDPKLEGRLQPGECVLDIDASGRYWRTSRLLGVTIIKDGSMICFSTEKEADEYEILLGTADLLRSCTLIITFNGNAFDLPHLRHKYAAYGLEDPLIGRTFRDLFLEYRRIAPLLGLPSRKLSDYASKLGKYGGKGSSDALDTLAILTYDALIHLADEEFTITDSTDLEVPGAVLYRLRLSGSFDGSVSILDGIFRLDVSGDNACLTAAIENGKIRVYHTDTENYYYLPLEGYSVHRTMAQYVDRTRKEKAVRENCFHLVTYNRSFTEDQKTASKYISSVLRYLLSR